MLNEFLLGSSLDGLKNIILHQLTIFHVALIYVLIYVVYKALGRYIYFKPQEHASKINRTFLTLSLLIILLYALGDLIIYLPFHPEYRWLFALCGLVILIAPLRILIDRIIWEYDSNGRKGRRNWHYYYLPISNDYYKTSIPKSETKGSYSQSWEEEGIESTAKNITSDVLLNVIALVIFIATCWQWAYIGATDYGWLSYAFSVISCITIGGIFFDSAIFSWISYVETKIRPLFKG